MWKFMIISPELRIKVHQSSDNFEMDFWCLRFPPKNERKQVDLRYHSSKDEFFRSFFGGNRRHQKPFKNHRTFRYVGRNAFQTFSSISW